jgi:hypothetical protein
MAWYGMTRERERELCVLEEGGRRFLRGRGSFPIK